MWQQFYSLHTRGWTLCCPPDMEAHHVLKVQNPEIFDVHGPKNRCHKLVWARLGTQNACRTCREWFWEVLDFLWFFVMKNFPSQNSTFLKKSIHGQKVTFFGTKMCIPVSFKNSSDGFYELFMGQGATGNRLYTLKVRIWKISDYVKTTYFPISSIFYFAFGTYVCSRHLKPSPEMCHVLNNGFYESFRHQWATGKHF